MTIPTTTNYPDALDTNVNLFLVHDALRVMLVEDYSPGDTSIQISGAAISNFPLTGFITLTEQCTEPVTNRAISFFYNSRTDTSFDELEILPGFTDVVKPKNVTNVTQNVMAEHHNSLKDALIAIEEFIGIKGTDDRLPLGPTMEGRLNFLRKLVLKPRAWFSVDKRIGIVPMKTTFKDLSFRGPTKFIWDFGDNTSSSVTTVFATDTAPDVPDIIVDDLDGGTIEKIYHNPGIYSVSLTVSNEFGEDTIVLPDLISARIAAPDEAIISFTAGANQTITDIDPLEDPFLYDHLLPGIINARTGTLIDLSVVDNGENPSDPVIKYTWKLSDDLDHTLTTTAKASYSVGGYYDVKLRVDTDFGAYRITTLEDAINIIERENLFIVTFDPTSVSTAITKNITAYEFGLVSETFKTKNRSATSITKDYRFLSTSLPEYDRQKREFLSNNNMAQRGTIFSGDNGTALVYWAEGATTSAPPSAETIRFLEYEGFSDVWRTPSSFQLSRPWNWIGINSQSNIYLLFGGTDPANVNALTNQNRTTLEMVGLTATTDVLTSSFYQNGADELKTNVGGVSGGNFSVYRSCTKDNNGYIVRNDGVGNFFRIKSFYRTESTSLDGLALIRKLGDMPGNTKLEGQLVGLANGVYFFNNSGEIAVYSPATNTWAVGGPGASSPSFRSLQDGSVPGFDEVTNTLLAASDGDRRAYLSYDYSTSAFIKFTEADLSFTLLPPRPTGTQFVAGVY
jgi:PKD repeat protein